MSIQALAWVLECSEARLGERCVLFAIANHANERGREAWPSVATIAREARLSEREVQYSMRKLVDSGELRVRVGAGPRGTNVYELPKMSVGPLFEALEEEMGNGNRKGKRLWKKL